MERDFRTLLVTGGGGFIGSNLISYLFGPAGFNGRIVDLDLLTYAGDPGFAEAMKAGPFRDRYAFERADIGDAAAVGEVFRRHRPDAVIHLAAESHVDRSILGPEAFVRTNIQGTFNLLEAARAAWQGRKDVLFHHASTDEVYGSAEHGVAFTEDSPYAPRSPYSASKAASDHLVRAWQSSYGLPVTLTLSSNNYGPRQFPEKFIPLMILNMLEGRLLPVYGDGRQVRDWIHVEDHAAAIWTVMRRGQVGRSYNVGGGNEVENLSLLERLIGIVSEETDRPPETYRRLLTFVADRPGHDRHYSLDCGRIRDELGWKPAHGLDDGLRETVGWYAGNRDWWEGIRSGEYRRWIDLNYGGRG